MREQERTVEVFGGRVGLRAAGREAPLALAVAEALLKRMHTALTRFDPASELCRLNADPRPRVPASVLVRRGWSTMVPSPTAIRGPPRPIRGAGGPASRPMPRRSRGRPASPSTAAAWRRVWPPT